MAYPADLRLDAPHEVENWRPLVHWLLALPHLFVVGVLDTITGFVTLVSWVVIVFTGGLPEGIARFQCFALRYEARVYSYVLWLREPYPPIDLEMTASDTGIDPLRVDIVPALTDRNRLTVALRFLWVIPIAIFAALVGIVAWFATVGGFFAVLFTGRWPEGLRKFVVDTCRLLVRVNAYARLLVDEYPPFVLGDAPAQPV